MNFRKSYNYFIQYFNNKMRGRPTSVGGLINFLGRVSNWLPDLLFMTGIDFTVREKSSALITLVKSFCAPPKHIFMVFIFRILF